MYLMPPSLLHSLGSPLPMELFFYHFGKKSMLKCFPPMPLISNFSWPQTNHHLLGGWEGLLQGCCVLPSSLRPGCPGPPNEECFSLFLKGFQGLLPILGGFLLWVGPLLPPGVPGWWTRSLHSFWKACTMIFILCLWPTLLSFPLKNHSNTSNPNTNTGDSLWLTSLPSKE